MRRDSVSVLIYKNSPRTPNPPLPSLASPRPLLDQARSTPHPVAPILRVNNRQVPNYPSFRLTSPHSPSPTLLLFLYPFLFATVSHDGAPIDHSSHGRRTSFASLSVNETIYQPVSVRATTGINYHGVVSDFASLCVYTRCCPGVRNSQKLGLIEQSRLSSLVACLK